MDIEAWVEALRERGIDPETDSATDVFDEIVEILGDLDPADDDETAHRLYGRADTITHAVLAAA